MMHEESETLALLRQLVRQFVAKEIAPISQKIDSDDQFPMDVFKKMGKMGFLGVTVPAEYGGSGMDYRAQAIIEEEIGYASASLALSYGAHSNLCLDNLYRNGTEEQREEFVPKLASGEWVGSLALTEPLSGSDALNMRTKAESDGQFVTVSGSKTLITNAPYSDLFLTYAKTGESYSAYVVLSGDEGFSRGKKFDKMGMRGSPTGEIFFDNVRIPQSRLVGKLNGGKDIILSGLNVERVILSFIFLGLARRALELSIIYSTERKQSGQQLHEFEMIQDKLAVMYTRYQTSKLLAYDSLEKIMVNNMNVLDAAAAIYYVSDSAESIAREAIQIHGGIGYVRDGEVERLLRDAILGQIGAGTTEIRKKLISQSLIKNYKKEGVIPE